MEGGRVRLAHLLREAITIAQSVPAKTGVLLHLQSAQTSLDRVDAPPRLTIDVLSGTAVSADGPLPLSPSEKAVLFMLGLNGRRLLRDVLAAELYGNGDPRNALNSLKVAVHRVRRRTGSPDVVRFDCGRYALADWVTIDLPGRLPSTSHDAYAASELYELELLRARLRRGRPGFMLEWAWFDETERRLQDAEHDITVALANDALRAGRFRAAVDLADELAREDPLDESAIEIIVRACIELGNGKLADIHYHRYASRVKREANSTPSDALQLLVTSRIAEPIAAR